MYMLLASSGRLINSWRHLAYPNIYLVRDNCTYVCVCVVVCVYFGWLISKFVRAALFANYLIA